MLVDDLGRVLILVQDLVLVQVNILGKVQMVQDRVLVLVDVQGVQTLVQDRVLVLVDIQEKVLILVQDQVHTQEGILETDHVRVQGQVQVESKLDLNQAQKHPSNVLLHLHNLNIYQGLKQPL